MKVTPRQFVLTFLLTVLTMSVYGQNTMARFKYEEAEQAYIERDYRAAIAKLQEAEELLGETNLRLLHLRILAQYHSIKATPHSDYDALHDLRTRCKFYLEHFGGADRVEDKYREVYVVSEALKKFSGNANFFQAVKYMYAEKRDCEKAMAYALKAADEGDHHATNLVGMMYREGCGMAENEVKAMEWFEKAAAQGNMFACYNIGKHYVSGKSAEDERTALEWFLKGAEQGHAWCMAEVGEFFFWGKGVPEDTRKAFDWYTKALNAGDNDVLDRIGQIYYLGGGGIERDYAKAHEFFERARAEEDIVAYLFLGHLYRYGYHVGKNIHEAVRCYEKAAEKGWATPMLHLGDVYSDNSSGVVDYNKAFEWYGKAAEQENAQGFYRCGKLFRDLSVAGIDPASGKSSVEYNYELAMSVFLAAAELGHADAMREIGEMYQQGQGVRKDKRAAASWYAKAEAAKNSK